jgi:hypothetical protein
MSDGCPITVPSPNMNTASHRCGQPLAKDARFCVKHEADRIRLSELPQLSEATA